MAHTASHLLEDIDSTGWWKSKYRKYLLIPGLPEVVLVVLVFTIVILTAYAHIVDLFQD